MEMAVESRKMASGGNSPSWQSAETETFCPPNLVCDGGGATERFVDGGWLIREF